MRWCMRESEEKRESRRERECFVSAAARLTERMENRMCSMCICVCVYFPIQYVCCGLCAPVDAAIRVHELLNAFAWL